MADFLTGVEARTRNRRTLEFYERRLVRILLPFRAAEGIAEPDQLDQRAVDRLAADLDARRKADGPRWPRPPSSLSSLQTMKVSSGRRDRNALASCGRSCPSPVARSSKTRSQPAPRRASSCSWGSSNAGSTRAYPMFAISSSFPLPRDAMPRSPTCDSHAQAAPGSSVMAPAPPPREPSRSPPPRRIAAGPSNGRRTPPDRL